MAESKIVKLYENLSLADEDCEIHEMSEEWKGGCGSLRVAIEAVGVNIFMFHFINQEEQNHIWQRGSWYFDKSLIILEKPEGMGNISLLRFNKVELWIQIHDVPIMCMNRRTAKWMAKQLGKVIEIPMESKDCWGKFMKVKVLIDISKSLKRWLRLKLDKSTNILMVSLKYERLPEFCYVCGRIGHASKECFDEEAKIEALKGDLTKYGSWMRASVTDKQKIRFNQQSEGNLGMHDRQSVERRKDNEVVEPKFDNKQKPIVEENEFFGPDLIDSGLKENESGPSMISISPLTDIVSSEELDVIRST
ncbi:hypothetical protein EZV62_018088 [Acer yangbiense]|uniref:CCHC-type domain-containing protein n=1 Tax=Acer yangbiense TaxID=1000413 RepID=A0A5C7HJ39_9ROSI|nr:hypothetical protein EZV62_018088 [Acer yangbiense]